MGISMKIKVDSGKYEFSNENAGSIISIARHGEPWLVLSSGIKALISLMCELDAARVVLQAARDLGENAPAEIKDALKRHQRLVSDQEKPSDWSSL
jgi:hypothetical protein